VGGRNNCETGRDVIKRREHWDNVLSGVGTSCQMGQKVVRDPRPLKKCVRKKKGKKGDGRRGLWNKTGGPKVLLNVPVNWGVGCALQASIYNMDTTGGRVGKIAVKNSRKYNGSFRNGGGI